MNLIESEKAKYDEIWSLDDYRKYSPGLENVERFMKILAPRSGSTVIDIGCGTGEAGLALEDYGLRVKWLDLSSAALDGSIMAKDFFQMPIWSNWSRPMGYDYGFCCDVMEHIPIEFVMLSLSRIISNCNTSWLQICNLPDTFGAVYGKPLHLTVQPFTWWLERLRMLGTVTDARDLCGTSLYVVKR